MGSADRRRPEPGTGWEDRSPAPPAPRPTPHASHSTTLADLWLLLNLRRRVGWNTFRARPRSRRILYGLGYGFMALWLGGGAVAVGYGAGALLRAFPALRLEPLLPGAILTIVALLILFSSFGVALGGLFLSDDLELLMTAPVDARAVFASKILDGLGWYYALVLVTAVPALITYGFGLRYGPLYYLLAIVAVLGTPLLPAGLGALLVMLVARFAPARRVREMLGLVGALVGLGCSVIGQTSRVWTQRLGQSGADPRALLDQVRRIQELPLPSLVAGRGLAAAGEGAWGAAFAGVAGFLVLTIGSFIACVLLAERLYAAGWVRMQSSGVARRSRERAAHDAAHGGWLGRAPSWAAIALKDWRVIPRDLRNFAALLSPLLILPVVYVNLLTGGRRGVGTAIEGFGERLGPGAPDPAGVTLAAGILTATLLVFSRVAQTGISMEGRSWWILKAAPITPFELLRGKFLAAMAPFAILSTLLLAIAAAWRGFGPLGTLYGWFGIETLGAAMLALAVGTGVPWAKLDWDDPRKMSSGWGGLIGLAGSAVTGLLGGLCLCLPLLAGAFRPALLAVAWVVGPLGALAVSAAAAWAAFALGARFLGRVGEA